MNMIEGRLCSFTLDEYIERSVRLSRLEQAADAVIQAKNDWGNKRTEQKIITPIINAIDALAAARGQK